MKTFTITTPLYYVNDVPHIGHAYTTVAADVLARWKRLCGDPVFFLTGTDEHGSKIELVAKEAGSDPKTWADRVAGEFARLWKRLDISNDDFIRTTEARHVRVVQSVFSKLKESGDIYLGTYEDWYCVPDESYYTEAELNQGKCPSCGRPVEKLKEESYFFRLSHYQQALLDHYSQHPEFLRPAFRAQEIVNFVSEGLRDLSVSRTRVPWGIPVPFDSKHTVYVWFDALLNYITATGYEGPVPAGKFEDLWPANVHFVGKEIFRFHTVIWPAMLMALHLPLPETVFAHGWWTVEGQKMSKSVGNVVDPHQMCEEYGVDAFRYFLLREVPFGGDGDFSQAAVLNRYNAELANALGNLVSRTLTLISKNFHNDLPEGAYEGRTLLADLDSLIARIKEAYGRQAFHEALDQVWSLVWRANKYIDEQAPWKLGPADKEKLSHILAECSSVLQVLAILLTPVMPTKAAEIWQQVGRTDSLPEAGRMLLGQGVFHPEAARTIQKGESLFPRKGRWK